jgi:hypothetical protein
MPAFRNAAIACFVPWTGITLQFFSLAITGRMCASIDFG